MSRPLGRRCALACSRTFLFVGAALFVLSFSRVAGAAETGSTWTRIYIPAGFTRLAVEWALEGAFGWLKDGECPAVFSEFRDGNGRQIGDSLTSFGVDGADYLRLLIFKDGTGRGPCEDPYVVAFTAPRSRVVYVCGLRFYRSWQNDRHRTTALLIHEALHTLGLGENPPTSGEITHRVLELCRPR